MLIFSQIWRLIYIKFGEDRGRPSALPRFVLHFRYFSPFRNAGDSKKTGVEN